MNRILKIILLPLVEYRKTFILVLFFNLLIILINFIMLNNIELERNQILFDDNLGYAQTNLEQLTTELDQENIEYQYTFKLIADQSLSIPIETNIIVDQKVNVQELEYTSQISEYTVNQIQEMLYSNNQVLSFSLLFNFNAQLIDGLETPNLYYGIEEIIIGKYPQTTNKVLIPEIYAQYLISENNNYNNYEDLIGQEIKLTIDLEVIQEITNQFPGYVEEYCDQFIISGVYKGQNSFIVGSSDQIYQTFFVDQPLENKAIIINFVSSEQKDQFISNNEQKIYTSEDFESFNFLLIYKVGFLIILMIISIMILYKKNKYYQLIINHYQQSNLTFALLNTLIISLIIIIYIVFIVNL